MIKIRKPYFTAGQKFGWNGEGVGINISHLQALKTDKDFLEVEILSPPFKGKIRKDKARKLFTKHKSLMNKGGVNLVVLPLNMFEV